MTTKKKTHPWRTFCPGWLANKPTDALKPKFDETKYTRRLPARGRLR